MVTHFIKEWRKARGWSQQVLADKVSEEAERHAIPGEGPPPSWGRTDVVKYERGVRDPPLTFINAMAIVMDCRPGEILDGPAATQTSEDKELARLSAEERAKALRLWKVAHEG